MTITAAAPIQPTRLITELELKMLSADGRTPSPKRQYPPRSPSYFEASVLSRSMRRN